MCQPCHVNNPLQRVSASTHWVSDVCVCGSNGFDVCLIQVSYCIQIIEQKFSSLLDKILNFIMVIDVAQVDFQYVLIN